jgi:hypothetical protein
MDTTSPDRNQARSADPNSLLLTILAEQRAWMERTERTRRRHLWWIGTSNLTLRPLTTWVWGRITDLLS